MELQYDTPQDKLLVMLLERISSLEDEQHKLRQAVEKSNANLEQIWTKSSSVYFGICMRSKRPPITFGNFDDQNIYGLFGQGLFGQQYNFTPEAIEHIKNIITNTFPQSSLTVTRNPFVNIYIEFNTQMLLDTVKDALELQLLRHVHIVSWSTLSKSEMTNILQRTPHQV